MQSVVVRVVLAGSVLLGAETAVSAQSERAPGAEGAPVPASEVARKQEELRTVVAELRGRDVSHLDAATAARRAAALDELEAYARRGSFTLNTDFAWPMPSFIDRRGTRCAVAHLMDHSGADDLLARLAAATNHAHVAELLGDEALRDWCRHHGFSLTEIASIQAPGMSMPVPQDFTQLVLPPRMSGATGLQALADSNRLRQRKAEAATRMGRWEDWWTAHRHRFVDVRQRYHDAVPLSRQDFVNNDRTPRRPKREDWTDVVRPALRRALADDEDVATTAMVALARGAHDDEVDALRQDALGMLPRLRDADQAFVLLALGILGDESSAGILAAIVRDEKEGRRALGRNTRPPERLRAFAAVALGECDHDVAREALREVVDLRHRSELDLRSSALLAMGRQLQRRPHDLALIQPLLALLRAEEVPTAVRAHVPLALAHCRDGAVLSPLLEPVAHFREPAELRRTCSQALGRIARPEDRAVLEALKAQVRRDPDAHARRSGVMALASLGSRFTDTDEAGARALNEIRDFLRPGLHGAYRQNQDMPWICLAAGLLVRTHPERCVSLRDALRSTMEQGERQTRAAASLALGLAGDDASRDALRAVLEKDSDAYQVGYAAEALGLLNAKEARDALLALVSEASTEFVRYQAAVGLALLAEPSVLEPMVKALEESNSTLVQAGLTRALGEIGDRTAIETLVRLMTHSSSSLPLRMRAAGTLGMTLEPGFPSWVAPWKESMERSVATNTPSELLDLF